VSESKHHRRTENVSEVELVSPVLDVTTSETVTDPGVEKSTMCGPLPVAEPGVPVENVQAYEMIVQFEAEDVSVNVTSVPLATDPAFGLRLKPALIAHAGVGVGVPVGVGVAAGVGVGAGAADGGGIAAGFASPAMSPDRIRNSELAPSSMSVPRIAAINGVIG
jgi:hypothetical protein